MMFAIKSIKTKSFIRLNERTSCKSSYCVTQTILIDDYKRRDKLETRTNRNGAITLYKYNRSS